MGPWIQGRIWVLTGMHQNNLDDRDCPRKDSRYIFERLGKSRDGSEIELITQSQGS